MYSLPEGDIKKYQGVLHMPEQIAQQNFELKKSFDISIENLKDWGNPEFAIE